MPRTPSPEATSTLPSPSSQSQPPTPDLEETTSLLFSESQKTRPSSSQSLPPSEPQSQPKYVGNDDSPSAAPSIGDWRKRRKALLEPAKAAVKTAAGIAHTILTSEGSVEREYGLWLADDDDEKAIAEPLAGLASRRLPEGAENPDITDLVELAFGLATYVMKQFQLKARIRQRHRAEPQAILEDQLQDATA